MKLNILRVKKITYMLFSALLFLPLATCFGQEGYQQPRGVENSYDSYLQGNREPGIGTATRPLRGKVVIAPAGSRFSATLISTLSSGINRVGDVVDATVSTPLVIGSSVVIPAGSQIKGQVVNAIPAKRFKAGSGGVLEIRFTALETPDGQTYPLSAQLDTSTFQLQAETGGSRIAKGVGKAAVGAGLGAALGTAIGAIAGGMPGRGAWSGAAIGGGLGALNAIASKGAELILESGIQIPILLDQNLQVVVPQRNQ